MTELLTVQEVADRLKVDDVTVRHWLQTGELKGSKIGGRGLWRVSVDDLINYLEENSNTG